MVSEYVVPLFVPPAVTPRSDAVPQSFPVLPRPTCADNRQIAITRIDHSGRVGVRWLVHALGWSTGDRHDAHPARRPVSAAPQVTR